MKKHKHKHKHKHLTLQHATPQAVVPQAVENPLFLALDVTNIDSAYEQIDLQQLFAQALALDPKLLTLSRDELDAINEENNQYKKKGYIF